MKDLAGLLDLDCNSMLAEIGRGIGRPLTIVEQLDLAMLSGAYKANGSGVTYCDLEHPPVNVSFPQYLKALGYPAAERRSRLSPRTGEN
jgi:hypothetical protein